MDDLLLSIVQFSDEYTFEMYPCGGPSPRLKKETDDESIPEKLIASPVPSSKYVNILGVSIGDDLYMYDVLGNLIQKVRVANENFQIDITLIPGGVYYVKSLNNQCIKIIKTD